jgi:hypothetical protein
VSESNYIKKACWQERLDVAINYESHAQLPKRSNIKHDKTVTIEITVFEEEDVQGPNLRMAYEFLKTVPLISIESKHGVSSSGNNATKLR